MSDLAQVCSELRGWIAIAETLIGARDQKPGVHIASQPSSRPPWNSAVADALLDAWQGVRELELEIRTEISGRRTARPHGPTDVGTRNALKSLTAMEPAMSTDRAKDATAALSRWANVIRRLPAVDDLPHWMRIRPGPDGLPPRCPYCQTFSLRVALESGVVACWLPGCSDSDGNPPRARLDISRINAEPVLAWSDGSVT
jgi:hypothetical protein